MIQTIIGGQIRMPRRNHQNYWLIGAVLFVLAGAVLYMARWRILAILASICGYLLQADTPHHLRSLAGKGLGEYGRRIGS